MTDDKILTLHPDNKKGVNISRHKYEIIKSYILKTLEKLNEISYQELNDLAISDLSDSFDGRVNWYVVVVKLDLEARNIIERIPGTSPHKVRMVS